MIVCITINSIRKNISFIIKTRKRFFVDFLQINFVIFAFNYFHFMEHMTPVKQRGFVIFMSDYIFYNVFFIPFAVLFPFSLFLT